MSAFRAAPHCGPLVSAPGTAAPALPHPSRPSAFSTLVYPFMLYVRSCASCIRPSEHVSVSVCVHERDSVSVCVMCAHVWMYSCMCPPLSPSPLFRFTLFPERKGPKLWHPISFTSGLRYAHQLPRASAIFPSGNASPCMPCFGSSHPRSLAPNPDPCKPSPPKQRCRRCTNCLLPHEPSRLSSLNIQPSARRPMEQVVRPLPPLPMWFGLVQAKTFTKRMLTNCQDP